MWKGLRILEGVFAELVGTASFGIGGDEDVALGAATENVAGEMSRADGAGGL